MKVNWAMISYCIAAGDPLEVLIRYTKSKNLRLVDLFAMIDNDKSGSVSRQELIHGVTVRISLIYMTRSQNGYNMGVRRSSI